MKTNTILFLIFGIYTSFSINAKSQLFEYKCHVLVTGKIEAVIDVTTKKNRPLNKVINIHNKVRSQLLRFFNV